MTMQKILLVEDDREIAHVLQRFLQEAGFIVTWASTGVEGWEDFQADQYALVLVDIMVPEMDGYRLCQHIRWQSDVPVMMISAKNESRDKVYGLDIGADDYVTKPFSLEELLARIQSQLRRYKRFDMLASTDERVVVLDDMHVFPDSKRIVIDGKEVKLTPKEYAILELLIHHPGTVFHKHDIYEHVWKESIENIRNGEHIVTVHMRSLRQKIGESVRHPRYIETVWGSGYRALGSHQ